jgi:transketolase
MRKAFVEVCEEIIHNNENAAVLLGDIGAFGFRGLISQYPKRVMNLGILEQAMIGVGAGIDSNGKIPIIHTIAPFLIDRAFEQIKVDFGYQKLAANLVSVGASFDYSSLGCTHHAPEDIGILSQIPGVNIFIPGHREEFKTQFLSNWNTGAINYFRLSESQNETVNNTNLGDVNLVKSGGKVTVLVVGPLLDQVIPAVEDLDVEILYINSFLSNKQLSLPLTNKCEQLLIVEPYYSGFLASKLISEVSAQNIAITQLGVPKKFIRKYGKYEELLKYSMLDSESIRYKVEELLSR